MQPSMVHSHDQPSGYRVLLVHRHTQDTTHKPYGSPREEAQLVPTDRGRMCTLTNENVIPITCITIEALNTNDLLVLIFIFLGHGFLR